LLPYSSIAALSSPTAHASRRPQPSTPGLIRIRPRLAFDYSR